MHPSPPIISSGVLPAPTEWAERAPLEQTTGWLSKGAGHASWGPLAALSMREPAAGATWHGPPGAGRPLEREGPPAHQMGAAETEQGRREPGPWVPAAPCPTAPHPTPFSIPPSARQHTAHWSVTPEVRGFGESETAEEKTRRDQLGPERVGENHLANLPGGLCLLHLWRGRSGDASAPQLFPMGRRGALPGHSLKQEKWQSRAHILCPHSSDA